MTGFLRDYLLYIFAGFIILIGGAFAIKGGFSFKTEGMAKIGVYEIILTRQNDFVYTDFSHAFRFK